MKNISKLIVIAAAGALAAAALTGCSYTKIRDTVVDGYQTIEDTVVDGYTDMQDGIVDSWNDMVDGFVADAPKYGLEAPAASGESAQ